MALTGKQAKLDKNNNGEIDAEDFKMLQARRDSAANYKNYGVGSPANIKRMCGKQQWDRNYHLVLEPES